MSVSNLRPFEEGAKTAFDEILVGELHPIFQGSFEYTVSNTELNTNTLTNGGTVTQAKAMALVGTSTTTASDALFQSYRHAKYRPGLGSVIRFTALFTTPVLVTEQYIGIMDTVGSSAAFKNGMAIGYDGTTFGCHRWQNDTLITVKLADCDDPLDGTGPSGMTLDTSMLNVFFIRFQYLGAGAIEYCVEDDMTGKPYVFHRVLYANNYTAPSTYNPNYYFTIWTNNKATTSDLVIKSASYAYFVEGKTSYIELHQPKQSSGVVTKTTVTTEVAILTIRNKTTYASLSNFLDILIENVSGSIEANSANNQGTIRIIKNATLGGTPSYSDINTTDSVVDLDTAGTTITGGVEILSISLAGKNDKINENLISYEMLLKEGETLTVAGTSVNSATIKGSILWKELF